MTERSPERRQEAAETPREPETPRSRRELLGLEGEREKRPPHHADGG
jgi:hypothetical protein